MGLWEGQCPNQWPIAMSWACTQWCLWVLFGLYYTVQWCRGNIALCWKARHWLQHKGLSQINTVLIKITTPFRAISSSKVECQPSLQSLSHAHMGLNLLQQNESAKSMYIFQSFPNIPVDPKSNVILDPLLVLVFVKQQMHGTARVATACMSTDLLWCTIMDHVIQALNTTLYIHSKYIPHNELTEFGLFPIYPTYIHKPLAIVLTS